MRAFVEAVGRGASRCRSSCPGCSTTTASSTRATPAPCWASACPSSTTRRIAGADRLRRLQDVSRDHDSIRRLLVANRGEIARRVFAHLPPPRHRDRRRPLRRRRRRCRSSPRPTRRAPAGQRPGRDLPARRPAPRRRPGAPAPTRSTPATASSPRTPTSPAPCIDAGLTWVGPAAGVDRGDGLKIAAKKLMAAAGVPVLDDARPGDRHRGRPARCWSRRRPAAAAAACASCARLADLPGRDRGGAGRGGVGVRRRHGLRRAVRRARPARRGAGRRPTAHGDVLVLGERDCSIQRRHQKVVEEAPAPGLPDDDPRRAARRRRERPRRAIGYAGAGTVEFLVRRRGRDALLLPGDEHPAPGRAPGHRAVTGVDLVELQLAVAEGRDRARRRRRRDRTATRSRSGSTPRTRPPTGSRRAGR